MSSITAPAKSLTLFGFFAITASMVMTVSEYPTFATAGLPLVFFECVSASSDRC